MIRKVFALMALACLLAPLTLPAQDSLRFHKLDEINRLADYPYLTVNGSLSAVTGQKGLIVTDHSDPERPISRCIAKHEEHDRQFRSLQHLAFSGDLLWHFDPQNWQILHAYRISSLEDIEQISEFDPEGMSFIAIAAQEDILCAMVTGNRFAAFDVSNPQNPRLLASIDSLFGYGLALHDGFAYIFQGDSISIIDLSNPEDPTLASSIKGWSRNLAYENDHLFVLRAGNGFQRADSLLVFNVSDPTQPEQIAQREIWGSQMTLENGLLALTKPSYPTLRLYSLDDDFELELQGETRLATHHPDRPIFFNDQILVPIDGMISIFDANLREITEIGLSGGGSGKFFYHRGRFLVPGDSADITSYALVNQSRLRYSSRSPFFWPGMLPYSKVVGDVLYCAYGSLYLFDVSDPDAIRMIDEIGEEDGWPGWYGFDASGFWGVAPVSGQDGQLQIFCMEDPLAPEPLQVAELQGEVSAIRLGVNALFATIRTDSLRLVSFDLFDPWEDPLLSQRDSIVIDDGVWEFKFSDDRLYVPQRSGTIIFDVFNIGNIVELSRIDSAYYAEPAGDYLFCGIGTSDVAVFDLSDPTQPVELSRYHCDEEIRGLVWGEGILFVQLESGVLALEVENWPNLVRTSPAPLSQKLGFTAFPNPFNSSTTISYSLPASGWVSLTVYDLSGRLVERLLDDEMAAGRHSVVWDAKGVPSGVYLTKMEIGKFSSTRKVALVQ